MSIKRQTFLIFSPTETRFFITAWELLLLIGEPEILTKSECRICFRIKYASSFGFHLRYFPAVNGHDGCEINGDCTTSRIKTNSPRHLAAIASRRVLPCSKPHGVNNRPVVNSCNSKTPPLFSKHFDLSRHVSTEKRRMYVISAMSLESSGHECARLALLHAPCAAQADRRDRATCTAEQKQNHRRTVAHGSLELGWCYVLLTTSACRTFGHIPKSVPVYRAVLFNMIQRHSSSRPNFVMKNYERLAIRSSKHH